VPKDSKPPDLDGRRLARPAALILAVERPGSTSALRAALARPPQAPALLVIDRPQAPEPVPIDVTLSIDPPASHCRHARCCQCGAARGTPEHAGECPDAAVARALAKRREGHTARKLLPKKAQP